MSDLYVQVRSVPAPAMVTLRADLDAAKVKSAIKKVAGLAVPGPRRIEMDGARGLAWMAPDELLVLGPEGDGPALAAALDQALAAQPHLVADVSDARLMWELEGPAVREVLAKLTPADVAHLPLGEIRRSRLAQVAAGFWLPAEGLVRVIAFRSVGTYVTTLLTQAARSGSEVG